MKCRHCDHTLSVEMIDLGAAPPSNAFHATKNEAEHHYPLRVLVCDQCWLAQTDISLFSLNYDELFTKEYPYYSSTSPSWVKHAREYVESMTRMLKLGKDSMVIEVGSNDGYLLQHVQCPCYGVEPTRTGEKAKAKGIMSCGNFFGSKFAQNAIGFRGKADLMIANNVLAHVPDINDFVKGFEILLKDDGIATFEFPHVLNLVRENQFDTIYHEHYSYLSLHTVLTIFETQGLRVFDVEALPTHGGSLRVFACKGKKHDRSMRVEEMLQTEYAAGVTTKPFYQGLQKAADAVKNELMDFLLTAKQMGRTVAGFGAAAKGNTLLNYAGVRADWLPYVVDDTPEKQGMFLPGSRIPVVSAFHVKPDYVLILPWNFKAEIMEKLSYIREWGGKFVTAIPRLEVV